MSLNKYIIIGVCITYIIPIFSGILLAYLTNDIKYICYWYIEITFFGLIGCLWFKYIKVN